MPELNDDKPPEQAPQVHEETERRSPGSRWRRRGIAGSLLTSAGSLGVHAVGGPAAMMIGAGVAAAGAGGVVLWHLPKIRHHLNDGRRTKTTKTRTRKLRSGRSRAGGARRTARPGSSRPRARPGGTARRTLARGGTSRRPGGALARRTGTRATSPLKRASTGGTVRKTGTPRRHGTGTRARSGTARGPLSRRGGTKRHGSAGTRRGLLGARGRGGTGARTRPGTTRRGSARPGTGTGRRPFRRPSRTSSTTRTPSGRAKTRTRTHPKTGVKTGTTRARTTDPKTGARTRTKTRTRHDPRTGRTTERTRTKTRAGRGTGHTRSFGTGRIRFGFRKNGCMPEPGVKVRRPRHGVRAKAAAARERVRRVSGIRRQRAQRAQRAGRDLRAVRLAGRTWRAGTAAGTRARNRAGLIRHGVARTSSRLAHRAFRRRGQMPRPASNPAGVKYTMHPPKPEQPPRPAQPRPKAAGHTEPLPTFARHPVTVKNRVAADSPVTQAAEAVTAGFAGWEPQNAADLRGMFDDIPHLAEAVTSGISALAAKFENDLPVDSKVADGVREMLGGLAGLQEQAEDLKATFEQAHETELNRIDNPRPAEEVWDTGRDQTG